MDSGTTYLILPNTVFDAVITMVQGDARQNLGPELYDAIFGEFDGWWEGDSSVCLHGLLSDDQVSSCFSFSCISCFVLML